jgi:hypothetical protein
VKVLTILFLALICLIFLRCSEDSPESPPANSTGKLFVQSNPPDAHIYLKGINTGKITPDTIKNLEQGSYNGFLALQYYDTTYFTANVFNNTTSVIDTILTDGLPIVEFIFDFQLDFGDDSVRFNFTINQDVTMDSVKVGRPVNSTGTSVTDKYSYNAEPFGYRDQSGNLKKYYLPSSGYGVEYYPAILNRDYYFNMFGHKAYGAKVEFRSYYLVNP